jgi:hypothetical protein
LALGVLFAASRQVTHAAVDLDGDAQPAEREIYGETAYFVLPYDMHASASQLAQRRPGVVFGKAHAAAEMGALSARRISHAPMPIIGSDKSMPKVM